MLQRWVMLYLCENDQTIYARYANQPWGPWSARTAIFNARVHNPAGGVEGDNANCHFMHNKDARPACDTVAGDNFEPGGGNSPGAPYAPCALIRFTTARPGGATLTLLGRRPRPGRLS